ncbi:MAG: hypothetical protein V3T83_21810, partial [Acidobacteriota bacterium]
MNTSQRDVMIAFPGLPVVVAMAVGIYTLPPALDSARPEVPRRPSQDASQVPARLWQDPLQAFWDLPSAQAAAYLQESAQVLQGRLDGPGRTLLLPVLIPGSGSSESHETRLRL